MLTEYITKTLNKIAKNEGFVDFEIKTDAGSNHGDNFQAVLIAVTLSGTKGHNGTSKPEELHLMCKASPTNESRKKNFKSDLAFNREIYAYSKVLPAFVRFQQEKGLSEADSFVSFPKVYACEVDPAIQTYILVMEDLRARRFEMWPKDKVISLDQELMILRELAKFHAVSFAMKDQRPAEFEELKPNNDPFLEIGIRGTLRSFLNRIMERAANVLENPEHKRFMMNFCDTYANRIEELLTGKSSKELAIVGHGDCWSNNFLFQYDENNKNSVQSISLLDWQFTRYCPAVVDLLYHIFSATDKQFRKKHYSQLLKTYYESLSETIRKLGSDPKKLYTYEDLEMQLRKFGEYALLCGPMVIQVKVANAKDVGNLDDYCELVERGEEPDLFNKFDEETEMKYSELINGLFTDLVDYGYVKL